MNVHAILRTTTAATFACAIAMMGGCSGDGRIAVSGTVTLDGQPLEVAAINFRPAPGNDANSAGGGVQGGKFSLPAGAGLKPGEYLVNVMARKETGRMVFDPQRGKEIPETAPVRIKENGVLKINVEPGGKPLKIELTSDTSAVR
ncbi:MAG: hypothetical protein JXM70_20145 [Pirellulales bacterium]|nr:hypothetical protein [Pirellulales bacterium]